MKKVALLLAASTTLAAVPAFAQDAQDAQSTFTGPRIEGLVGYDKSRSGSTVDNDALRDRDQSIDGVAYGAGIGYDFATAGGLVIGAEAEYLESSADWVEDGTAATAFNLGRVDAGRDLYVGARLGLIVSPKTMVYAKAGYTNARYEILGTDGTTELSQRIDTDGYRVGAGVEYALSPNTFAKVEYRYSNYSKGEVDFDGETPDSSRFNIDTDRHQVMAGFGLRF